MMYDLKPAFFLTLAFMVMLVLCGSADAASKDNDKKVTDKQLSHVKQAIERQKSTINKYNSARNALEQKLKTDDLAIAKVAKEINFTQTQISHSQAKITELASTKTELSKQKRSQEQLLAQQLRAAYTTGHHDYLKLILNQEQAANIQRTVTYYEYLNAARIREIDQFQKTLSALLQVTTEHQNQLDHFQVLKQQQNKHRLALQKTKGTRAKTLTSLNQELLSSQQQLVKLEAEENNLVTALKKLESLVKAQTNLSGLSKLKKKLNWPVKGRLLHSFGSQKQGYLQWKGVLLSADNGQQVQTIHDGTVLFADWLKGYGLVTVIDHGNGYMSLYGHNQTLLKNVGDRVETGEPIALVGQSGGQNQASLYFEIRHRGKAVNPKLWCINKRG